MVNNISNKQKIQKEALNWISLMNSGLSSEDKYQLTSWINQDKYHHEMIRSLIPQNKIEVLDGLSGIFPVEPASNKPNKALTAITIVFSFIVFLILAMKLVLGTSSPLNESIYNHHQTFATKVGEHATYALPDGTSAQLNTNSLLVIDYSENQRRVTLEQGEANFDVAKDKNRPFTVISGDKSFTALGTIFNVQKDNEFSMELMVTEGKVLIAKSDEALMNLSKAFKHSKEALSIGDIVNSGEKAIIANNEVLPVKKVDLVNVQQDLSWQQGMLIFNGTPLTQVLEEVSRYSDMDFQLTDPNIANIKISGYFKIGDVEGLLASLHHNFKISHTQKTDNIIYLAPSLAAFSNYL